MLKIQPIGVATIKKLSFSLSIKDKLIFLGFLIPCSTERDLNEVQSNESTFAVAITQRNHRHRNKKRWRHRYLHNSILLIQPCQTLTDRLTNNNNNNSWSSLRISTFRPTYRAIPCFSNTISHTSATSLHQTRCRTRPLAASSTWTTTAAATAATFLQRCRAKLREFHRNLHERFHSMTTSMDLLTIHRWPSQPQLHFRVQRGHFRPWDQSAPCHLFRYTHANCSYT